MALFQTAYYDSPASYSGQDIVMAIRKSKQLRLDAKAPDLIG
jgi:hypothetical protein